MQRMVLRKVEATAKGGHAFPFDLFEMRAVDEAIADDQWGLKWPEAR
jgi:hypothetical protein